VQERVFDASENASDPGESDSDARKADCVRPSYEHPIELPQLRHSQVNGAAKTHETSEKQARNAPQGQPATATESAERRRSQPRDNMGGTLWDETVATLNDALRRAETSEERLAILAELRAWRERP
jgi:hypothetical protein